METSSKLTALIILLVAFSSCISDPFPEEAQSIMERTDIVVSGDIQQENFAIANQGDGANDLVSFNYYGNPSEKIDFIVNLDNGNSLFIEVYDAQNLNPWEQIDLAYNIYPGQDLDDKLYYTNIIYANADGSCAYSTNFNDNIPPGIFIDVFKVIKNDGNQIQCRIRDMILYKTEDVGKTIHLNGTFIGAMNFY